MLFGNVFLFFASRSSHKHLTQTLAAFYAELNAVLAGGAVGAQAFPTTVPNFITAVARMFAATATVPYPLAEPQ